jgi:hypothetical protein
LIPLLTLFLVTSQIAIAVHARDMQAIAAQDGASVAGINGTFSSNDTFIHIDSPDPHQNLDLVIRHKKSVLPRIVPGLIELLHREPVTDVSGIAVVENRR